MHWHPWRRNKDDELDEEIRAHLAMAIGDAASGAASRSRRRASARGRSSATSRW
jgi:hypothetical protein